MILKYIEQNLRRGWGHLRPIAFSLTLVGGIVAPAFVSAGNSSVGVPNDISSDLMQLEMQADALSQSLNVLSIDGQNFGLTTPDNIGMQPAIYVAQNRDSAALNLRISQMEEQMRSLTGQVEGLQFQMTQLQTLLERMQEDNEFRFQQLEGGGSGKTEAAIQSGGDRPSVELPQNQNQNQEQVVLSNADNPTDLIEGGAKDNEGEFFQPDEGITLGDDTLGDFRLPNDLQTEGQALDLNFDPGALVTDQDAEAQYKAGFDAIMQGDYDFAQTQFYQFVALFPDHVQAPDATNLLGEALLQSGNYDEAAQVLFAGFEIYQNTSRGPDILFGLGRALAGAGEQETACRTFSEVLKRYPNVGNAFELRLAVEITAAQC